MPKRDVRGKDSQKRKTTVLFLGGGRITSAMLAGLRLAKHSYRLLAHDRHPEKLRNLKKAHAVNVGKDLTRAIAKADVLIIAVRPDAIRGLLETVRKSLSELKAAGAGSRHAPLSISLAAGVPLRALRKAAGDGLKLARAMPSPSVALDEGSLLLRFLETHPAFTGSSFSNSLLRQETSLRFRKVNLMRSP